MSSNRKYKLAIYIGRFQPFHNGHIHVISDGLKIADKVLVMLGSSNTPYTVKNPFNSTERTIQIQDAFEANEENLRLIIEPINDYTYDENRWILQIQDIVGKQGVSDSDIVLLGYQRDDSSYYLHNFPRWQTYFSDEHHHYNEPINGTKIRDEFFESPGKFFRSHFVDMLPNSTITAMKYFAESEAFEHLKQEWNFLKDYKESWKCAPYPPIFVTSDACVIQSGHVLLIQRKDSPGRGLWAMPGGFVDQTEEIFTGCLRELREETGLKVPEKVLRGSLTYQKVFDNPRRSSRGRTVTHAFLFELKDGESLPRVRAGDDAATARWFSFSEIETSAKYMFEDHWGMLTHLIARSK